jgi:hypothetical protein
MSRVRTGYLLIADISGYTAFLTGNELEHAHEIIEDLARAILSVLTPPVKVVKLEGDAVFAVIPDPAFSGPDRLLDSIDATYRAFADRKDDIIRATTCGCGACRNVGGLELKFLGHYGSFISQDLAGVEDVAGPDVILVHRLLKNSVVEATGLQAYAFLTAAAMARGPLCLPPHAESYEAFPEVTGGVHDLHAARERYRATHREYVREEDADFSFTMEVPLPVAEAWDYWVTPSRVMRFFAGTTGWDSHPDEVGRVGLGSTAHCAHGRGISLNHYIDWMPFKYFSSEKSVVRRSFTTPPPMVDTTEFVPTGPESCRVTYRFRVKDRGAVSRGRIRLMRPLLRRMFAKANRDLIRAVEEERQRAATAEAIPAPA